MWYDISIMLPTFTNTVTPIGLINFVLNILELVTLVLITKAWRSEIERNLQMRKTIVSLIEAKTVGKK